MNHKISLFLAVLAFLFPSFVSAETISLSPQIVTSGQYLVVPQQFTVNWTAPVGHSSTDWVGIFVPGTPSDSYLSFNYINSTATSGTTLVTVPQSLPPGNYEVRYFINNQFIEPNPTVRAPLTIIPAEARTLTLSPATVISGQYLVAPQQFTVNWTAPVGHSSTDWVGIFVPGTSPDSYLSFNYINSTATSGTTLVTVPQSLPAGNYEIRYFLNNSFAEPNPTVRAPLTIIPAELPTLTLSLVAPGQPFTVNWTAPEEHGSLDWIGLFVIGAPNSAYTSLAYLHSTTTSGTVTFTAPPTLENYEVRYLVNNSFSEPEPAVRVALSGATSTPATLTNPTETEDDGNQDAKGVADKTNFTFGISYTGATAPSDVTLWTNDGTITNHYQLTQGSPVYTMTSTFPKGHYSYHFEANGGAQRLPETGELEFRTGYSNVAFLPGLEASRLYRPEVLSGKTETQVWEPTLAFHDNAELFLDASGTPIRNNLYTKRDGEIDEVLGANIYESFIDSMNGLVESHIINAWKPLPYDWRFDVRDIVDHPIALEAGSYSMTEEIQKLAESSDTGKVTLIAHSNGGLVSKVLADRLAADGSKLLDQMIFVASPQAGTPQAVGAILHGYNQGIPKDWLPLLINSKEARDLAVNMPSAYGLLPSTQYFTYVDDPVITFDNDPLLQDWRAKYGIEIYSAETLHNFLADQTRTAMPVTEETKNPIIGNETLLNSAENLHNTILDNWAPPPGVTLTQIAGWGEDTLKSIVYYQGVKTVCANPGVYSTCVSAPALEYSIKEILDGDGTVVVPSALWTSGVGKYWVDLRDYNKLTHGNISRKHADILEVDELREFVKNLIVRNNIIPDNYILTSAPPPQAEESRLHFTLHSPLTLDLYDNLGNHTGISTTTGALEENIPGSRYKTFGELKYISAPSFAEASAGEPASTTLHLVMNGYATGSFTLDMEEVLGDTVTASTTFAGIPSSTSTVATITLPDGNIAGSSPLSVDENGDGTPELILAPKLDGIVTLPKPILTVIANNQAITLGLPIPSLSATLSPIPNDVTGTPDCTTTATASSTVGTYPIICTIGTLASNTYDFAFTTGTLSIIYRFDGFLQPINDIAYHPAQAPSVFKGGSTVPVKFQIKNLDGTPVQASTLPTFSFQRSNAMSASVDESTYTDPATTGTTFRWDSASQQYLYNWSTKGVTPGYGYKLSAKLDDGKTYSVMVGLR